MNSVQIIGNLARDPQVRATKTGRAVASFTVAVNNSFTTPQGERREVTDWINVVAWGSLAEAVGNQLRKGSRVFVEGRYTTRSYDDQNGQRRWATEVTANMVAVSLVSPSHQQPQSAPFGGNTQGYGNGGFNNGYNNGYGGGFNNPAPQQPQSFGNDTPQQPQAQTKNGFSQFGPATGPNSEEIPF